LSARADPAAAPPLDEDIAMHTTIRRSIAAIALTALLSTTAPLRAGESDAAPTAADKDFAEASARIDRARSLYHHADEHGLAAIQARFRFTTTAFVNEHEGKAVVGQLVWSKETGVLAKIDDDSPMKVGADGPLMSLGSLMKGPTGYLGITPRDRVISCDDDAIEVVAHTPGELRNTGVPYGWEGAPTVRFTFDERGRVLGIRSVGSPAAGPRSRGAPNCLEMAMEWADGPDDRSSVVTRMRLDLLTESEGEQEHAAMPFQWLDNHFEYTEVGDARVMSRLVMDIGRGEGETKKFRRDELVLTEIEAREAVPAGGLEGFQAAGTREAPPEPIVAENLAPEWSLMSSEGERFSSKDSEGKAVVLMFWSTWCGPCKLAAPVIQKLIEEHGAENLAAYAITCSETRIFGEKTGHDAGEVLRSNGGHFPALVAGDDVASEYGVPAYPTIFVLDQTGKIVWRQTGFGGETPDELRAAVATAVASAVASADASNVR
jgi:thiol-disulfide isomerase/thioredoxin